MGFLRGESWIFAFWLVGMGRVSCERRILIEIDEETLEIMNQMRYLNISGKLLVLLIGNVLGAFYFEWCRRAILA